MRDFDLVLAPIRIAIWMLGTAWLGTSALYRGVRLIVRWRWIVSETLPCPRGHQTPTYGVFECRCGGRIEGWAFSKCPVCLESAGWMPCSICGLVIRNPTL
jgi:hypothetical protein